MDPVTHILLGVCLSRSGLNRRAAYATLTMAVAAEFPDIDILWALRGPVANFQHHRGITHTFIGIPFEAGLIVAAVYVVHRLRVRAALRRPTPNSGSRSKPLTPAPARWGLLYGFALLALLSHLLLDYTNNYGLRPLFPFHTRWYSGSFVFIFDPVIFAFLLLAVAMPPLFGMIGSEIGARRSSFRGRGWATAALLGIAGWWTLRAVEHVRAVQLAQAQTMAIPQSPDAAAVFQQPVRVLANPDPINPFLWHTVSDFDRFYQLGEANLLTGALTPAQEIYAKPERTPAVLAAQDSPLGRVYLDWSPMPFITASHPGDAAILGPDDQPISPANTLVTFRDPRFMLDLPMFHSRSRPPLTGTVELDAGDRIVEQTMDGKAQR